MPYVWGLMNGDSSHHYTCTYTRKEEQAGKNWKCTTRLFGILGHMCATTYSKSHPAPTHIKFVFPCFPTQICYPFLWRMIYVWIGPFCRHYLEQERNDLFMLISLISRNKKNLFSSFIPFEGGRMNRRECPSAHFSIFMVFKEENWFFWGVGLGLS